MIFLQALLILDQNGMPVIFKMTLHVLFVNLCRVVGLSPHLVGEPGTLAAIFPVF
jgi:hypothetical protein